MKTEEYGKIVLRISLSLVFLWFGITQLYAPENWTGLIPEFLTSFFPAKTWVLANGAFEVIFGLMLLVGLYTRVAAALLTIHLLNISFSLEYSAIAIRDFGLTLATFAVFLMGADRWTLDEYFLRKKARNHL